jgi:hypothetical protein
LQSAYEAVVARRKKSASRRSGEKG